MTCPYGPSFDKPGAVTGDGFLSKLLELPVRRTDRQLVDAVNSPQFDVLLLAELLKLPSLLADSPDQRGTALTEEEIAKQLPVYDHWY